MGRFIVSLLFGAEVQSVNIAFFTAIRIQCRPSSLLTATLIATLAAVTLVAVHGQRLPLSRGSFRFCLCREVDHCVCIHGRSSEHLVLDWVAPVDVHDFLHVVCHLLPGHRVMIGLIFIRQILQLLFLLFYLLLLLIHTDILRLGESYEPVARLKVMRRCRALHLLVISWFVLLAVIITMVSAVIRKELLVGRA